MFKRLLVSILLLIGLISGLYSLDVPQLTGRVNDYAQILSAAEKSQLESKLARYEQETSNQLVLLTMDSLQTDNLESFSIRVAEAWKIGQKDKDNGLILLIVKNDRKIRVEVGYGLESRITDGFSGEIIRNILAPSFREGQFYLGIDAAFTAIMNQIGDEFTNDSGNNPYGQTKKSFQLSEDRLWVVFIMSLFLGMILIATGEKKYFFKGLTGSVILPIIIFMVLGFPFNFAFLILLMVLGVPYAFLTMLLALIFMSFRGGYYGGGGFGSGGGGFSGGGGSFGGGGASGSW